VAVLVAGPLFAWLSDHVSRKLALGARSAANTLSSVLYIVAPTFGGFMAAKIVDDSGKAAFRPTWGAILAEVSDVDPQHRARTITFVDSAYSMGEFVGPPWRSSPKPTPSGYSDAPRSACLRPRPRQRCPSRERAQPRT
jgi:predicted MFS family arabinose efflux permease